MGNQNMFGELGPWGGLGEQRWFCWPVPLMAGLSTVARRREVSMTLKLPSAYEFWAALMILRVPLWMHEAGL